MQNKLIVVAVAAAFAAPLSALADAAASPVTANVSLASEYLYRGIAQTAGKPALQGGFDYAHSSGLYAGAWGSNISWLSDLGQSSSLEVDVYGGYKGSLGGDLGYDVGVLTYNYPGHFAAGFTSPDTTEIYGALSWKFLTIKYSTSTSNLFGNANSKNSDYLELNASYDLGDGWGVSGHIGNQTVKNVANADYTDWKIGATKDVGIGVVGLAYSSTDAKDNCAAGEFYCFTPASGTPFSAGRGRAVLSFSKSF